jgi:hypothetical protein
MRDGISGKLISIMVIIGGLTFARPVLADVGGTIFGVVHDPSGAAVPGAKITLTSASTGLVRTATTDESGSYQFLSVPVGDDYQVTAEAPGFDKLTRTGVKLLVNQKYQAEMQLRVGSIAQSVDVASDAVQVETASTQVGDVIESSKITAVPLNGRSYLDLLGLQAGVVPFSSHVGDQEAGGNISVNGQRENANAYDINGITVERSYDNGASVVPVLDAIEEFRLLTSTFDAEYGRFSGAVVNVVTKSGTNHLHGTLFEFLRNDVLDAAGYFDTNQVDPITQQEIPNSKVPKLERNQFGGTLGGAIIKNKLFVFGDYQGTREIAGISTGRISVPSQLERTGDFSDVGATGYSPLTGVVRTTASDGGTMDQVLTQRLGYTVSPGEPYWVSGCNTLAQAQAGVCVFPGQVIPNAAWSPAATGTLSFLPNPTFTADGAPFYSNTGAGRNLSDNTYETRVDFNTHATGTWTLYYHYDNSHVNNPYAGGNVPGFAARNVNANHNATISDTFNFGSTAVNELHLGFTRSVLTKGFPQGPFGDITSYGFQKGGLGIVPGNADTEGLPSVSFNQLGVTFGLPSSFSKEPNNIFMITDNFSKIWGHHTAKFGFDGRYIQFDVRQDIEQNGVFGFDGNETGNDFADFLIGAPDSYGQASRGFTQDARAKYVGLYAQDSWKIKPNLTLNYGLRWEMSEPFYDTKGRIQAFIPGLQSIVFPDSPEGWVFPGDPGVPSTIAETTKKNFAPRLGIAYSPGFSSGPLHKILGESGKTSIRAGFGIYYTSLHESPLLYETGDAPFGLFYTSPALVYLEEPFKSRTSANDPGQRFPVPEVTKGSDIDFSTWMPVSGSTIVDRHNVLPRTTHYNLNIQRQLTSSMILTLAYVGSQGHHLITQIEANPGDAARCLAVRALFAAAGNPDGGCGPGGEDSIYTIGGQTYYGTRPYSVTSGRHLADGLLDFGSTLPYATTSANSSYNSFQATLEKRVGRLNFLAAYTWGKSMDNSSSFNDGTNPYNPSASKSLSAYDVTHNFVISYVYQLPFGRWVNQGFLHRALDGWAFSGITRFTTGFPVTLSASGDNSLCGCYGSGANGVDVPNYNGDEIHYFDPRSAGNQYFSTAPFSPEEIGVPGNSNRRFFHGPGTNNTDLSLLKDTKIKENLELQFRAEFFNVFNHANFDNPVGDISSPNFGQVLSSGPGRIGQLALKLRF